MSNPLRAVVASATLFSLVSVATGQEAPTSSPTRPIDYSSKGQDKTATQSRDPAPLLWDGLSPNVVDSKTRAQQKGRTPRRKMPAEIMESNQRFRRPEA